MRRYRRKTAISRPLGRTHKFVRSRWVGNLSSQSLVNTYGAYQFKLSDLPNYAEFTALFDEYMIYSVKLVFMPTAQTVNTGSSVLVPWAITVVDTDDNNTPSTYEELLEYPAARITTMSKKIVKRIYPRQAVALYNGGVTNGYGSRRGYVDCANYSVNHYGLKYAIGYSNVAGAYSYSVFATYTIICRGVH